MSAKLKKFDDNAEKVFKVEMEEDFNKDMQTKMMEGRVNDTPNFFDWREVYQEELSPLVSNIDIIANEARAMSQQPWIPWPEDSLNSGQEMDWTVFPFLHTFPVMDNSRSAWLPSTTTACPKTSELLKKIPNIRTALFSRMVGKTILTPHTGWCDLSNYVLRCHICLDIPKPKNSCGLTVGGETTYHKQNEVIVFDDSKRHHAFNDSDNTRIVLILDILRPVDIPIGKAIGGHTSQLNGLISKFG
jgi:ornithine lipid ester-linked acyl 2-hydroxylase